MEIVMSLISCLNAAESVEVDKLMQDPEFQQCTSSPNKLLAGIQHIITTLAEAPTTPSPIIARALKFSSDESTASGGSIFASTSLSRKDREAMFGSGGGTDLAVPGLRGLNYTLGYSTGIYTTSGDWREHVLGAQLIINIIWFQILHFSASSYPHLQVRVWD